jgi:hypothetical protein
VKNYSQNNEQEIILNYFGDFKGHFLDIGAYNGVDISNTRALLELGWTGVLVEPNPFNLVELIKNCQEFGDRATIYCAGAGSVSITNRLRLDDTPGRGWAASFSEDNPGVLNPSLSRVYVPILSVWHFLIHGAPHLISIDAEWLDEIILEAFVPKELEQTRMIIIEPTGGLKGRAQVKKTLAERGFNTLAETPENIIAAR